MNQKKSRWKKEEQQSQELPTKRVSGKAFAPLYGTSSTPDWHGSSGQFDNHLLAKQGYTHTLKDFVVVQLTPWIRAECPTKLWFAFGERSLLGLFWKESVCTEAALQLG